MLRMVSYPRRLQSGHITCYLNRTYHVLTTAVFSHVAVVRARSDTAHCRASQCPVHYRSRVVACYETGAESASTRAGGRPESDRCRESGAAVSRLYVSGSPPVTRGAGFVVAPAIHPTADRAAQPAGAPPHARSCVATLPDNAEHKPGYRHKECSSRDTEL